MYSLFGLLLILLAGSQQGELVQGVDDARKDDARFGTRGRSLLQSVADEEIISMSMTGCDPSQGTGACGPSFQEECVDDLPTNTALECSDYVKLDLCGEIDEEFCKVSCNRCPEVCEDVLVPLTIDCTKIVDGNKCDDPEIKGIYCQKSCGYCQVNKALSTPPTISPISSPSPPLPPPPTPPAPLPSAVSTEATVEGVMEQLRTMTSKVIWDGQDYCSSTIVTCDNNKITSLDLSSKGLKGTIPAEISVLTALTYLGLDSYVLNLGLDSNDIKGTIPAEISALTALTSLNLGYNDIEGTIPSQISALVNLKKLYFTSNAITGTLPREYSTMELMEYFYVYSNSLSGVLPVEYSSFSSLEAGDQAGNLCVEDPTIFQGDVGLPTCF